MQSIPTEHEAWQAFLEAHCLVYADSDSLRSKVYALRSSANAVRWSTPQQSPTSTIDVYDAVAHHLLLLERNNGASIATARLIPQSRLSSHDRLPLESRMNLANWIDSLSPQGASVSLAQLDSVELDPFLFCTDKDKKLRAELALYLGAMALGQLLFLDYLISRVSVDTFRQMRIGGLPLGYVSALTGACEGSSIASLDLNKTLPPTHSLFVPLNHIAKGLAPSVNMPLVQES